MDLDVQHNLTLSLVDFKTLENEDELVTSFDLAKDYYKDPSPIPIEVIKLDGSKGYIHIIPSLEKDIVKLIRGELPLTDPFALKHVVEKLKDRYDYILLDLPPVFLASSQWGLFISDFMIVPINATDYSQYSSYILVKDILPRIIPNKKVKVLGFLINNVNVRNPEKLIKDVKDDLNDYMKNALTMYPQLIEYFYPDIVFNTYIPQDAELRELIRFNDKYPRIYETIRKSTYGPTTKVREIVKERLPVEIEQRIHTFLEKEKREQLEAVKI
jgi:cellulose biosynthesis protein BcsQ